MNFEMNLLIAALVILCAVAFFIIKNFKKVKQLTEQEMQDNENAFYLFFDLIDLVREQGLDKLLSQLREIIIDVLGKEDGQQLYDNILIELKDSKEDTFDFIISQINNCIPGDQYDLEYQQFEKILKSILDFLYKHKGDKK